jgi:hypothetical protein
MVCWFPMRNRGFLGKILAAELRMHLAIVLLEKGEQRRADSHLDSSSHPSLSNCRLTPQTHSLIQCYFLSSYLRVAGGLRRHGPRHVD